MRASAFVLRSKVVPAGFAMVAACGGDPSGAPGAGGAGGAGSSTGLPSTSSVSASDSAASTASSANSSTSSGQGGGCPDELHSGTVKALPGACADGFCWVHPTPQGAPLLGAFADAPGKAWFVGAQGQIVRLDGATAALVPSGTAQTLRGVSGAAPNDVWAVGSFGTIAHYDGLAWTASTFGSSHLRGVWALGAAAGGDVWAVGDGGTILRRQGGEWKSVGGPTELADLYAVWASGPTDVWMAGKQKILRWDGAKLVAVSSPVSALFTEVWGSGPNDVWFGGSDRELVRWNGAVLEESSLVEAGSGIAGISGSGPDDVWLLSHYDSSGVSDLLYHYDGTCASAWQFPQPVGFDCLAAAGPANAVAAGISGAIARWDGNEWSLLSEVSSAGGVFGAIWASAPDEVWVSRSLSSKDGLWRFDGKAFLPVSDDPALAFVSMWGSAKNAVWGASPKGVSRWDGASWTSVLAEPGIQGLGGTSDAGGASDVWAVGLGGAVRRWNGAAWESLASGTTADLHAVWAASADDVWIVGDAGTTLHWDGSKLEASTHGTKRLAAVSGTGPSDVWIGGGDGALFHFDGGAWKAAAPPSPGDRIDAIVARGPNDVWFMTDEPAHWDGAKYTVVPIATGDFGLQSLAVTPAGEVWVGGANALLRRAP